MEDRLTRFRFPSTPVASDRGTAALGTFAGFGALFSAAACCILPLGLGAIGVGAGGLAAFVPFHWPLTVAAMIAVAAGWLLYLRKRRACDRDATCTVAPPARTTLIMLSLATGSVVVSALWSYIEASLMRSLGGA